MRRDKIGTLGLWLSVLLGLPIVLGVGFYLWFPAERIEGWALEKASAALGAEVTCENSYVQLFPLGVRLNHLAIDKAPENHWGLKIESLTVGVNVGALLGSVIEVSQLQVLHPTIEVWVQPSSSAEEATDQKVPKTTDFSEVADLQGLSGLRIKDLHIKDAEIIVFDAARTNDIPLWRFERVDVRMHLERQQNMVLGLSLSLPSITKDARLGMPSIETELRLELDVDQNRIDVPTHRWHVGPLVFDVQGQLPLRSLGDGSLDLEMASLSVTELIATLQKHALIIGDLRLNTDATLALSFNLRSLLPIRYGAHLHVDGTRLAFEGTPALSDLSGDLHLDPESIQLKNLSWRLGQEASALKALVKMDSQTGTLNISDFSGHVGLPLGLAKPFLIGTLDDIQGVVSADFKLKGAPRRWKYAAQAMLSKASFDPKPLGYAPCEQVVGAINMDHRIATLQDLSLRCGGSDLKLSGHVEVPPVVTWLRTQRLPEAFPFSVQLRSEKLDLERLMLPQAQSPVESEETGQSADQGTVVSKRAKQSRHNKLPANTDVSEDTLPQRLNGPLRLDAGRLLFGGLDIERIQVDGRLKEGTFHIAKLDGRVFDGTISGTGRAGIFKPEMDFELDTRWSNLAAKGILGYVSGWGTLGQWQSLKGGRFKGRTVISGRFNDAGSLRYQMLNAAGDLALSNAVFGGSALQQALATYLQQPALAKELSAGDLTFAYKVAGGNIIVDDGAFRFGDYDGVIYGRQGFDGALDTNLVLNLPTSSAQAVRKKLPGSLAGLLLGSGDRVSLPFVVTGTANKPQLRLNESALSEALKENARTQVQKKLQQSLQSKLKKQSRQRIQKETEKTKGTIKKQISKEADKFFKGLR